MAVLEPDGMPEAEPDGMPDWEAEPDGEAEPDADTDAADEAADEAAAESVDDADAESVSEDDAEPESVLDAEPEAVDENDVWVSVTPTSRHSWREIASAAARSDASHADCRHSVSADMKSWSLHRHAFWPLQLFVGGFSKHESEQPGTEVSGRDQGDGDEATYWAGSGGRRVASAEAGSGRWPRRPRRRRERRRRRRSAWW